MEWNENGEHFTDKKETRFMFRYQAYTYVHHRHIISFELINDLNENYKTNKFYKNKCNGILWNKSFFHNNFYWENTKTYFNVIKPAELVSIKKDSHFVMGYYSYNMCTSTIAIPLYVFHMIFHIDIYYTCVQEKKKKK